MFTKRSVDSTGSPGPRSGRLLLLAAGFLAALPAVADAQYFGRNKVQYEERDFRVLDTDHFDIHYYPVEEAATRDAARMAERWYDRLSEVFVHEFDESTPLILYADQPDFQQTNTTPSFISEATGGFTEGLKDRVVMPFAGTYGDTHHVLGHELVHAFQYDIGKGQIGEGPASIETLPLWAIEGLAEYFSLGRREVHTAMWLRDALLREDLPTLGDLSRQPQRYFPYRWGHAFWAYIGGRFGDEVVATLYRQAGPRGGLAGAIRKNLRIDPDSLGAQWQRAIEEHYGPLIEGRTPPLEVGEPILRDGAGMMLAPSLGPDGEKVVFLSRLDLFTVDLFVADAKTGEVLGKLASSSRSPHFDALAYTNTTGSWSPDGERFAFVAVGKGDNLIAIADVEDREVVRRLELGDIGAASSVTWSPDGASIVFAGQRGGIPDLWRIDPETGEIEQLTDDRFAEIHPDFSPDGRTIAFATDRGPGTSFESLRFSEMGLGFLDLESGRIEVRRPFGEVKHVNPVHGPDGQLWFVSDREGFSDVYRLDVESGETSRVTRVATGVTGITGHAPALSVARDTGELALTVFHEGSYRGRTLGPEEARGEPVGPAPGGPAPAALLPPVEQAPRVIVSRYLGEAGPGIEEPQELVSRDYDPGLRLDFIAPPTAGVAVDRFGTAVGGSIGLFWSDMLGDQNLGVALQAGGGLQDVGGEVLYRDLGDRLNWGVIAGRIPTRAVRTQVTSVVVQGQQLQQVDFILLRQFFNRASIILDYPFSMTRRVEFDGGYTRLGFDIEVERFLLAGGTVVQEVDFEPDAPEALDIGHASAAYVEDFSFFGFTSPVRGGRARLEVTGNAGDLNFVNLLADWRRYWFNRPLTFAVRALHFGRYGGDADSPRLTPLFLGHENLVRGYESGSFTGDECTVDPDRPGVCPEFERLIGTRVGVLKAELRIPLVGTEQFGIIQGGFLPTELSLFTDAGVAWTEDESPEFELATESFERIPVFSSGASLRLNFGGRLVAEFYLAYPFQRPEEGARFGFQLAPGW
ncbi:MAG: BamA/TamA family outer membrane protein [Gemmatimonadota bacterium]|nr:BamA/TamA family outer membrane protein [Gemmatimonadota bacterium]